MCRHGPTSQDVTVDTMDKVLHQVGLFPEPAGKSEGAYVMSIT